MSDKLKLTDVMIGYVDLYEDLEEGVSPMCTPEEMRAAIRELRDLAKAVCDDAEECLNSEVPFFEPQSFVSTAALVRLREVLP